MTFRKRKQFVQMDAPKPRMTVGEFDQWQARQMLAFPAWLPMSVAPGDRVNVTMIGDGSEHLILIVEDEIMVSVTLIDGRRVKMRREGADALTGKS